MFDDLQQLVFLCIVIYFIFHARIPRHIMNVLRALRGYSKPRFGIFKVVSIGEVATKVISGDQLYVIQVILECQNTGGKIKYHFDSCESLPLGRDPSRLGLSYNVGDLVRVEFCQRVQNTLVLDITAKPSSKCCPTE